MIISVGARKNITQNSISIPGLKKKLSGQDRDVFSYHFYSALSARF